MVSFCVPARWIFVLRSHCWGVGMDSFLAMGLSSPFIDVVYVRDDVGAGWNCIEDCGDEVCGSGTPVCSAGHDQGLSYFQGVRADDRQTPCRKSFARDIDMVSCW